MAGLVLFVNFILNLSYFTYGNSYSPILEWKRLEFEPPNPIMVTPYDIAIYYPPNNGSFSTILAIPRYDKKNPMTLVEVTNENRNGDRIVKPFPNEKWHNDVVSCPTQRLVSVYRTRFDKFGRIWVLDSGFDGTVGVKICSPQILAFDLTANNKLVHNFEIPDKVLEPRSLLLNLVLDEGDNSDDMFIYLADSETYSIIIYDVNKQDIWKITDKTMYPDPKFGTVSIAGTKFELMDGILGMDLEKPCDNRRLFYTSLNSGMINWVFTSHLKEKSRFNYSFLSNPDIFHNYKTERTSSSGPFAIDNIGNCYFGLSYEMSLNCWHIDKQDYGDNIFPIYQDNQTMQYIAGIKIVVNPNTMEEELWWMTIRLQKAFTGDYNPNEVNYRIFMSPVADIKKYTNCSQLPSENQCDPES